MIRNHLLASLPSEDYERLLPNMEDISLPFGTNIYNVGDTIDYVYFLSCGLVSMLAMVEGRLTLDVGMVGSEGMIGLSLFLGAKTTLGRAVVQGKASAMRMTAADFMKESNKAGALHFRLLRYARSMIAQIAQSAACYRFHPIDKRLARRLLMMSDRMESNQIQMSHDGLSKMLGVRREAVTGAAGALRQENLISYGRSDISIIDRKGLEAAACECYSVLRAEEVSFPFGADRSENTQRASVGNSNT